MKNSDKKVEQKLLKDLQNISEKISDLIVDGDFNSIISLEKKRLQILKSFQIKPSDSGIQVIQNIFEKNRNNIMIIENQKNKLSQNFNNVKNIFLAYGK